MKPRIYLTKLLLPILSGAALGCGGAPSVDSSLAPAPPIVSQDAAGRSGDGLQDSPRPTPVVADEMTEDFDADEAALNAIRELEFRSLTKGGNHVRGVLSAEAISDPAVTGGRSRGGASGVTYDLDIESWFAHRRVQYYVDFFLSEARDRFAIWLDRLPRYEGMIHDLMRRYGVPEDMVYLALIESGYSNSAVSRASAVGMWQFIRKTGRDYGLRIDNWVDERRDPWKATDAAARYLRDLKEQFGSWYLAAAAYNGGPNRVIAGLDRLPGRAALSDTTFFSMADRRYLRRETRDYVPKLIAATVIAKEPDRYGFNDIQPMAPLVFDEVKISGQTGLDVIAELADTTTRAMMELNPHYFRGVTPPGEEVTVRVPRGTARRVIERYAALPVADRVNFIEHRIRRGETLSGISQEYGVRLRYIEQANPGLNPRRLRVGQQLIVPLSAAAQREGSARISRSQPASPPASGVHRVRSGDTLYLISRMYGVTVEQLRSWNGMRANATLLEIGQRLRVVSPNGG